MEAEEPNHLLSVLIPNHNYAGYIAEAINSVVAQDYGPIELIVVDDGSQDESLEIVDRVLSSVTRFANTEVVAIERNIGKLAAMNRALKMLSGEYCIVLDADDYLAPHYASSCIEMLSSARRQDSTVGFVYTDCNLISAEGAYLDCGKSTTFDPLLIEKFSFIPEPAVTVTRALREAAPFDETIRKGTKHHKWQRIIADGWRGIHLPEALFFYRMHEENLSGIGRRVLSEVEGGRNGERILSGYWPTGSREEKAVK